MSSSESEDLEGFESAEEDLQLSDFEDDGEEVDVVDLRRSLSNDDTEFKESQSNIESGIVKHESVHLESPIESDKVSFFPFETGPSKRELRILAENIKEFSHNVDADINPNSAESNQLLVASLRSFHNTNVDDLFDSQKDSKDVTSGESDDSLSGKGSKCEDSSEVEPFIQSIEHMAIYNKAKADEMADGWDFEDDDIELPICPEEENPSSLLSSSSAQSKCNTHPKEKIAGGIPCGIPFGTDDSGVDNSPSGWDFEDDFNYEGSPLKNIASPHGEENEEEESDDQYNEVHKNDNENYGHLDSDSDPQNSDNPVWSSWGGWGVSNLISTAGVSTLTQVTSGLSSMLENTLGAPDPEVLATQLSSKTDSEEEPTEGGSKQPDPSELSSDLFGFGNIIGGVKTLGNKVIDGGLETLETLGKKTMEVLQEGDPGLKKKRALLFQSDKVILSQVLRDAKEKAEASEKEPQKVSRKAQYETLFDDFHGLVHLEALEMISRQCEIKMQTVLSNSAKCSLDEFNEAINLVKHLYEEEEIKVSINEYDYTEEDNKPSNDDLEDVLITCMNALSLNVNIKHFLEVDCKIQNQLKLTYEDASLIHTVAISDLAQFTACSIELFHRIAELFIVKDIKDIENDFKAISRVARASKYKIGKISENYCAKLILLPDRSTSPLITNIFLEASNSSTYLDNAFELFAPILQLKAVQNEISHN